MSLPARKAVAALILVMTSASAFSQGCDSLSGQKCTVALPTGINMAYLETGEPSGEPIVLIHGFADNLRTWVPAMRALHELDPHWHILAVDLRGHGGSSMPSSVSCASAPEQCFRVVDFAADIVAFMKAKHLSRATLAGHSLGSIVVQEIALSHPELIRRVILVAATTSSEGIAGNVNGLLTDEIEGKWVKSKIASGGRFPRDFFEMTPLEADPPAFAFIKGTWCVDPVLPPEVMAPMAAEAARTKLGTWIGGLRTLGAFDYSQRLRDLTVPALVIWGSQDTGFHFDPDQKSLRQALTLASSAHATVSYWKQYGIRPLPSSRNQESDIGHETQWEAPDTMASDIAAFVKTGAPTSDLPHSDEAPNFSHIMVEKNRAIVVKLSP
jgi:pimeloyl-ACP methyl ester carboxylesterase